VCGIAGILGAVTPDDTARVQRMVATIRYRGPNARRWAGFPKAVLGHARLSILDLSDRGLQPMFSPDRRHVLVFNGEIYNYKELRRELEDQYNFVSSSDTEVLLAAYRRWGEKCLDRLDGMFAFCVYDTQEHSAFLARDRFGQKPLFIAEQGDRLLFASEVKSLLAAGIEAKPDREVWARYLLTAQYDDTTNSYFEGVIQLLPGEAAHFTPEKGLQRFRYYLVAEHLQVDASGSFEDHAQRLRELVVDACDIHMRSDVPVGIMLSGGLDSSSMLAGLQQAEQLSSATKCFSVDFGESLTERPWIEAAARDHDLVTRIESFTPQEFHDSVRSMIWHQEGPVGGLMNSALHVVMRAARDDGYTVLLDGTGPDEAFAGYRNHHNMYVAMLLQRGGADAEHAIAGYMHNWGVDERTARQAAEAELHERSHTAIDGTVAVRPELLLPAVHGIGAAPGGHLGPSSDPLRDSLIQYMQGSKVPRNLRMVDRVSMAYGIEVRAPFLDPRVVEFGLSLPVQHYFHHGWTKAILRQAMKGLLPDGVRLATKRSIQAPQVLWLRSEPMRSYVRDILHSESFASRGVFDVNKARDAYAAFCRGEGDNSLFAWQWINVEEWFRVFVDTDPQKEAHPLCPELWVETGFDQGDSMPMDALPSHAAD
jgi:asparagine synthase (glutamine-hydrolysing)